MSRHSRPRLNSAHSRRSRLGCNTCTDRELLRLPCANACNKRQRRHHQTDTLTAYGSSRVSQVAGTPAAAVPDCSPWFLAVTVSCALAVWALLMVAIRRRLRSLEHRTADVGKVNLSLAMGDENAMGLQEVDAQEYPGGSSDSVPHVAAGQSVARVRPHLAERDRRVLDRFIADRKTMKRCAIYRCRLTSYPGGAADGDTPGVSAVTPRRAAAAVLSIETAAPQSSSAWSD